MKHRCMKPLAFALAMTLGGSALAAPTTAFDVNELDSSIKACTDFNGFVNAKWVAANPIPADRTRWGSFDALREGSLNVQHAIVEKAAREAAAARPGSIEQKIGYLYASGMDEAAIERAGFDPLRPQLARIAGLKNRADVVGYIRDSYARGEPVLFRFSGNADFKDSNRQIAYAGQGGLGLPTVDYYSKPDYAKIRTAYVAHIAKLLELTGVGATDAQQQAKSVLAFETRLAAVSLPPVEMRNPNNRYHYVSLAEADKVTPDFDWAAFFKAQGAYVKDGFSLSQPKFFAEVQQMLGDVPLAQWQAYLRYHAIANAAPYLSTPFQQEDFAFNAQTLNGQKEMKPRWKRVLDATNDGMGMALGQLYVADHFSPASKQRAEELVANLSAAFRTRIEQLEWMSDATRQKALQKWATFVPKIGYPDKWRDWSGLALTLGDYYANVQAANKFNYDYAIAKIGKPVDRSEWGMTPQTVNAYYSAQKNEIVFPAAILQPPFFDANADDAINYGGIGAVIGHEMGHGYDDQGSKFDARGNNVNWWTDADRAAFEARTAKLGAQFDGYEALPGKHVNGQLTMGENIGDLGGLNAAYTALQMALAKNPAEASRRIDGYTQDQRFFLNWARVWRGNIRPEAQLTLLNTDPHAPAKFRAIGAPSNMPEFARAFQCKSGDAMVRDGAKQVKIW
ncbi:M13 family peptidase [Rhodanobacter denitrificans]|uniref:M13 family metallopeptidase n=1 Tax=Rhodanobacter denitrificans TaxID=666685 RepID=UPI000260C83F|nr:M13-type metalloendopeptidase [Rhodanobacter denitrificans]EIM01128.1 putative metalloendopeptidase [Rhodanobacter denitrificans]UJM89554.1 M13 family peptidase [Rhodanobacter denitrificans]